jgi:hypothetical protein
MYFTCPICIYHLLLRVKILNRSVIFPLIALDAFSTQISHLYQYLLCILSATFNDLDPKFQLTPELDLDHIFPEEYEMVAELRKRVPDLMWYSEKMIVVFLCARRHDLDETQDLIQKYLDKKKELGYRWKCPEVTSDPLVARLMQENAGARWPGAQMNSIFPYILSS